MADLHGYTYKDAYIIAWAASGSLRGLLRACAVERTFAEIDADEMVVRDSDSASAGAALGLLERRNVGRWRSVGRRHAG